MTDEQKLNSVSDKIEEIKNLEKQIMEHTADVLTAQSQILKTKQEIQQLIKT